MKFCPSCGTPREKNFCASCGFAFGEASSPIQASVSHAGLDYGADFDPASNCSNCGEPRVPGKSDCSLCGSAA